MHASSEPCVRALNVHALSHLPASSLAPSPFHSQREVVRNHVFASRRSRSPLRRAASTTDPDRAAGQARKCHGLHHHVVDEQLGFV